METLRLEHVSKDYVTEGSSVPALRDVNLEFHAGQYVALVGRSGCGKSTLLNLAGAMDFPTSGIVWLDGVNTSTLGDLRGYNVRLLGTDISDNAVARASEGTFSPIEIDRGLTAAARDKSFVPHPRGWRIRDERDRASLFNRIEQRIDRNGYLVIGSMESLSTSAPQFESKRHLRSVYYQIKNAAAPAPA